MPERRSQLHYLGLVVSLLLVLAANLVSYLVNRDCFDVECTYMFGFPFPVYHHGTFLHLDDILWTGVMLNVLVAIVLGLGVSWVIGRFLRR